MTGVTIGKTAEEEIRSLNVEDQKAVLDALERLPHQSGRSVEKLHNSPLVFRLRCPRGCVAVFTKTDNGTFHVLNVRGRDGGYNELDTIESGLGSKLLNAKRMMESIAAHNQSHRWDRHAS